MASRRSASAAELGRLADRDYLRNALRVVSFDDFLQLAGPARMIELNASTLEDALTRLRGLGVGQISPIDAKGMTIKRRSAKPGSQELTVPAGWLAAAVDAIEHAPLPDAEWEPVVAVLGLEETADRVGSSPGSVRRYTSGTRETPQAVAERLHELALIVTDLRGSYNDFGIRRWFHRPRTQLEGRAPAQILTGDWTPDDQDVRAVRNLAGALLALGAT